MAWYDTDWGYRKKFTSVDAQVVGTHDNFAWAIIRTDADLKTVANGGHVGKSDGTDFLVTSDDEVTKLDHEIVAYNGVTGKLWLYFRVPSLNTAGGDEFYLYYGNSGAADQQNKDGTWRSQFKGVWHLQESGNGTSQEFKDSSGNDNHGQGGEGTASETPTRVSGYSGFGEYAQDFDGTDDHIYIPYDSSLDMNNDICLSLWLKSDDPDAFNEIYAKTDGTDYDYEFYQSDGGSGNLGFFTDAQGEETSDNDSFDDTDWHHLYMGRSGLSTYFFIKDGVSIGSGALTGNFTSNNVESYIGRGLDGDDFNGLIQEVRIYNGGGNVNRALTEYNNIANQASFWTVGSEESAPGPGVLVNGITPGKVNSRPWAQLAKINSVG